MTERFDICLIALGRTKGREMRKTRPCLVVSPDEMNRHLGTVLIAPMTTRGADYPTRVPCAFSGRKGRIALDQLRAVDKGRLVRRVGTLDSRTRVKVLGVLAEMFAE